MEAIAIVGLSARLPQDVVSTEAFWELIREGRRATTEIPSDRMNVQGFYHPDADRSDTVWSFPYSVLTGIKPRDIVTLTVCRDKCAEGALSQGKYGRL